MNKFNDLTRFNAKTNRSCLNINKYSLDTSSFIENVIISWLISFFNDYIRMTRQL